MIAGALCYGLGGQSSKQEGSDEKRSLYRCAPCCCRAASTDARVALAVLFVLVIFFVEVAVLRGRESKESKSQKKRK